MTADRSAIALGQDDAVIVPQHETGIEEVRALLDEIRPRLLDLDGEKSLRRHWSDAGSSRGDESRVAYGTVNLRPSLSMR